MTRMVSNAAVLSGHEYKRLRYPALNRDRAGGPWISLGFGAKPDTPLCKTLEFLLE